MLNIVVYWLKRKDMETTGLDDVEEITSTGRIKS